MASRMILARSCCGVYTLISRLLLFTSRDAIATHLGPCLFRMGWDSSLKGAMLGSLTMVDFGSRIIESSDVLVPERILEFSKLPLSTFPQDKS